jgi:diguanylate cyclase (GGDEF)-like protein
VVDDSEEACAVLCEGLRLHNYHAIPVTTGQEALDACSQHAVDLMLLDVCLPDIDGYEVCKRLKANPRTADVPVVFVTVKGSPEEVARGYQLGAADYITKPYNLPMVMMRVDSVCQKTANMPRLAKSSMVLMDEANTDPLTGLRNRRYLLDRMQEEVDKAHRHDHPLSCVVFDVDDVRALDEELGPVSMDDLLAEVAMTIRSYSRTYDILGRYDGSVFVSVLPHAPLRDAMGYAAKIMREVEATTFSDPNFPTEASLSTGVVSCRNSTARSADYVLGEAMKGLLSAKSLRSNRLVGLDLEQDPQ